MVECLPSKQNVEGSSPFSRSTEKPETTGKTKNPGRFYRPGFFVSGLESGWISWLPRPTNELNEVQVSKSREDDWLPILQLGNLDIDLRQYSYVPADFSSYFPPYATEEWEYNWKVDQDDDETYRETGVRCRTPLSVVAQRLNLLGWSDTLARKWYDEARRSFETNSMLHSRFQLPPKPSYDALAAGVALLDVGQVQHGHIPKGQASPWHEAAIRAVEADGGGVPTEHAPDAVAWYRSEIEDLDTATMIHMLARNHANLDMNVTWWAYHEVIYGNLDEEDYYEEIGAKAHDRVMIVTEGKSDTNIIRKSLSKIQPQIEDFFTFIDMSENYPFTGVGNLSNFFMGLHKIGVLNNVIVLFDNDAEGVAKFEEALRLSELPNIRPLKLPHLPSLAHFRTIGPTGEQYADINGRAASIECFLDLGWESGREPCVRWTSYSKQTDTYQGELMDKAAYVKRFLALNEEQFDGYSSNNLEILLACISTVAEEIAVNRILSEW